MRRYRPSRESGIISKKGVPAWTE